MKKAQSLEDRYLKFQTQLLKMIDTIDDLLEDPLFQDCISGTEEVGLDQTKEFLDGILANLMEGSEKNIMTVDEMIANRIPDDT